MCQVRNRNLGIWEWHCSGHLALTCIKNGNAKRKAVGTNLSICRNTSTLRWMSAKIAQRATLPHSSPKRRELLFPKAVQKRVSSDLLIVSTL
jgi:hypothetical protein